MTTEPQLCEKLRKLTALSRVPRPWASVRLRRPPWSASGRRWRPQSKRSPRPRRSSPCLTHGSDACFWRCAGDTGWNRIVTGVSVTPQWWCAHRGPLWIKRFGRNTLPYRRRSAPISTKPRNALFGKRSTRTQAKQQNRWDNDTQCRADVISQHRQTASHPSLTNAALQVGLNLRKNAPQEGKNRGALHGYRKTVNTSKAVRRQNATGKITVTIIL